MRGCRPLEDVEVARVLESFSGEFAVRNRALFILGVRTGFRISELLSLRVGDVARSGRIVDRVAVARRHMKKKTEGRIVPLHPEAKNSLAEWLQQLQSAGKAAENLPLFPSRKGGGAMTRIQAWRILEDAFRAAEVTGQTGTHCLRKTFAGRVYAALGRDLVRTQKALGHRNINSTAQYLSFAEGEIEAAILAA